MVYTALVYGKVVRAGKEGKLRRKKGLRKEGEGSPAVKTAGRPHLLHLPLRTSPNCLRGDQIQRKIAREIADSLSAADPAPATGGEGKKKTGPLISRSKGCDRAGEFFNVKPRRCRETEVVCTGGATTRHGRRGWEGRTTR